QKNARVCYCEGTFGSVKCVVRVKNTEEAIACANDLEYGLSAAVFGGKAGMAVFTELRRITVPKRVEISSDSGWPSLKAIQLPARSGPARARPERSAPPSGTPVVPDGG
uniref:aldehyde dehydrogenase family protein n=1 Tax=Hydrogenophaga sp. TaxID=1904254 RepID=UPI00356AB760